MKHEAFKQLHEEGLISDPSFRKIQHEEKERLFSVHWELKTLLYLGVLLLSGGLGILIYENIDTIGHQVILFLIAALCAGCFYYCERNKLSFSRKKVEAPNSFFDYILLLGCLTFVTFITYLQYQYAAFGDAIGSATFIPMVVLFFSAYYFDHLGVLSLAITNLAAWMGIAITPMDILSSNNFGDYQLIYAGLLVGVLLTVAGVVSEKKNFKQHFAFTYTNFGMNILFISALAAMFQFDDIYFLFLLMLVGIAFYFYKQAIRLNSFYLMLMLTLYSYIALGYLVVMLLANNAMADMGGVYLGLLYFIGSGIGLAVFLISMNKKMKHHDSL